MILNGYLIFAIKLKTNKKLNGEVVNFGPPDKSDYRVLDIVNGNKKLAYFGGEHPIDNFHEVKFIKVK